MSHLWQFPQFRYENFWGGATPQSPLYPWPWNFWLPAMLQTSSSEPAGSTCYVVRDKATTEKRCEFMHPLRWTCWWTEKGLETLIYPLLRRQLRRMSARSPIFLGFIRGFPPSLSYNSEQFSLEGVTPVSMQVGVIAGICSLVREKVSDMHLWHFMTIL